MAGKVKTKSMTCYFFDSTLNKVGENNEKIIPSEFCEFINYLKDVPLKNRIRGKEGEELSIAFDSDVDKDLKGLPIKSFEGYISGAFMHRRDVSFPYKSEEGSDELNIEPIDLGTGIPMEVTYFLIHEESATLLYLNNRFVGNISVFAKYLSSFLNADGNLSSYNRLNINNNSSFYFSPIMNLNPEQRLADLITVKKFELKFLKNNETLDENKSIEESIDNLEELASELNSEHIYLSLSPEKGGSLNKKNVITLSNKLKKIFNHEKKDKITISGKDDKNNYCIIDLLNDNLLFHTTISYEGKYVPANTFLNYMYDEFEARLNQIII